MSVVSAAPWLSMFLETRKGPGSASLNDIRYGGGHSSGYPLQDYLSRPHGFLITDSAPFEERTEFPTDCVFEGICPRDSGRLVPMPEDDGYWAKCETCGAFWHGELETGKPNSVHVEGQW